MYYQEIKRDARRADGSHLNSLVKMLSELKDKKAEVNSTEVSRMAADSKTVVEFIKEIQSKYRGTP